MRLKYRHILLALALIVSASCSKVVEKPTNGISSEEAASLELSINIPQINISTKADDRSIGSTITTDPFNPDAWNSWEQVVDGHFMYRLTVFVIDMSNYHLVAYRDIYNYTEDGVKGDFSNTDKSVGPSKNGWLDIDSGQLLPDASSAKAAKLSFIFNYPLHEGTGGYSSEQLKRGEYRFVAIGNWAPERGAVAEIPGVTLEGHPTGVNKFAGLLGLDDNTNTNIPFTTIIESIKSEFQASLNAGISKPFTDYTYHDILRYHILDANSSNFCCNPIPLPLVMCQDLYIAPGLNERVLTVSRCFSRVRMTVVNNSDKELTINGLTFSSNFTKDKTFLFNDPIEDKTEANDPSFIKRVYKLNEIGHGVRQGAPLATNDLLLKSFTPGSQVGTLSSESNSLLLFDGYVLENYNENVPMSYSLDMKYEGVGANFTINSNTATTYNSFENNAYYLIRNLNGRYLQSNVVGGQVTSYNGGNPTELGAYIPENLVWQLAGTKDNGNNRVNSATIKTVGSTIYGLNRPTTNSLITSTTGQNFTLTYRDNSNWSIWGDRYVQIGNNGVANGTNDLSNNSRFNLYKLTRNTGKAFSNDIILRRIDPVTAVVSDVHKIARNDFINIIITVSFNEQTGEFEYEVKEWEVKDNEEIEFN